MKYAFVMGRLVADAVYHKANTNGREVPFLSIRLAINSRYKTESTVQYIDCVTFRTKLEQYLTKGTMICVAGQFFFKEWEYTDKEGKLVKFDKFQITADTIDFVAPSRDRSQAMLENSSMAEMGKLNGKSEADPFMMQKGKILNQLPDVLDFDDPAPF